jgi:hypothetical protein
LKTVEEHFSDKLNLFTFVSLSVNTIARRTTDLRIDIVRQVKDTVICFKHFSFALDVSTDSSESAQVLLFVRGVDEFFKFF